MNTINDFLSVADTTLYKGNLEYKCVINSALNAYRNLTDMFEINEETYEIFIYENQNPIAIEDILSDGFNNYVFKRRLSSYNGISHWIVYKIVDDRININKAR